jgi:SAM-dependent methyltransferase
MDPGTEPRPLLPAAELAELRQAVEDYTVDMFYDVTGPRGRAALDRADLVGVERLLPEGERLSAVIRLFLLGQAVPADEARQVLAPLEPARAPALLRVEGEMVRSLFELRPYGEDGGPPWWVLSDWGSDVRPGPLPRDHVLGIGAASLTLASATPRQPVRRALDLGTGCGIQALHLSRHAGAVTATDISVRALRLAATTAALSGITLDLRAGSLLDPVAGERFDQIVANPPFVLSSGEPDVTGGYEYRDSGFSGDGLARALLTGVPAALAEGGCASLLLNWAIPRDGDWQSRVAGWLSGSGCDAWVWQREVADPGEYVSLWLRDAGEVPGSPRWRTRYLRWTDWFDQAGIAAVGMGLVTLWRTDRDPVVRCEDVPQAVEPPAGTLMPGWVARQRWLAGRTDRQLLRAALRACPDLVRDRVDVLGADGWEPTELGLRQARGMRWSLAADDVVAGLVAACDGTRPLGLVLDLLAVLVPDQDEDAVRRAALDVVRDLVSRGILEPPGVPGSAR